MLTVSQIAQLLNASFLGDGETPIHGLSALDEIYPHHLVFADGAQYLEQAMKSEAAAIIVTEAPETFTKPIIIFKNPLMAFVELMAVFYPCIEPSKTIHPSASIGKDVEIAENVSIGAFAVIEDHAKIGKNSVIHPHVTVGLSCAIGENCEIYPHVTLYPHTILKNHVIIHAGSVIGSDGFGYKMFNGIHHKIPHVGHVVIESNVEIGANTVVDRATLGTTRIGTGTKIDNLVQIAHSVKLGAHNILCAFTGIAGSSQSGNHVVFAANVGVSDHVKIDDEVVLGARSGVPPKKHLKKGQTYLGNPARPKDKALEQEFSTTRIPFMRKHIQHLQDKVARLEEQVQQLTEETNS
ncbi:MAG: UDP-3-O-[3-hydroxymyristoyl] glucosamine N-acyltransferase [Pseudomonadota bacterium]|nr:UDP-3-O-[3-hydroxymyristoyl] glucosamine N-acyltransferase [Pseudomonadota bacterium]